MLGRAEWLTVAAIEATRRIFQIEALSVRDFLILGSFALLPTVLVELAKIVRARRVA